VRLGGVIAHVSPLSMMNHGFFNISPTLWSDFYGANGGSLLHLEAADRKLMPVSIERTARFLAPHNAVLYAVARKTAQVELSWPLQQRYRDRT
jgi:hypothetical protein